MLPNFKIVIGAIMFAALLFVVTGAGVVMPETYTRIGEMPEVGRPMMQRMLTDEPGQTQFLVQSSARRSDELDRLRERTLVEIETAWARAEEAEAIKQAALVREAATVDPPPEPAVVTVPALQPSGAMGTAAAPPAAPEAMPAETEAPPAAPPVQASEPERIAAAGPAVGPDAKPPEPAPRPAAKASPLHRIAKAGTPHKRTFHRTRFVRSPYARAQTSLGQNWYGQSTFQTR